MILKNVIGTVSSWQPHSWQTDQRLGSHKVAAHESPWVEGWWLLSVSRKTIHLEILFKASVKTDINVPGDKEFRYSKLELGCNAIGDDDNERHTVHGN